MRLVYITLARKILCYGSFPAKVLLGTNAYNSHTEKHNRAIPTQNHNNNIKTMQNKEKNLQAKNILFQPKQQSSYSPEIKYRHEKRQNHYMTTV